MASPLIQLPSIVLIGPTGGHLRRPFAFQGFLELLDRIALRIAEMTFLPQEEGQSNYEKGSVDKRGPHAHDYSRGLYLAPASVHTTRRNAESFRPPRHGWTPPREERCGLPNRFSQRGNRLRNRWPVPVLYVLQHSYDKNGNCFSSSMCRRDYGCAADFHRSQGRCTDHGCVRDVAWKSSRVFNEYTSILGWADDTVKSSGAFLHRGGRAL